MKLYCKIKMKGTDGKYTSQLSVDLVKPEEATPVAEVVADKSPLAGPDIPGLRILSPFRA